MSSGCAQFSDTLLRTIVDGPLHILTPEEQSRVFVGTLYVGMDLDIAHNVKTALLMLREPTVKQVAALCNDIRHLILRIDEWMFQCLSHVKTCDGTATYSCRPVSPALYDALVELYHRHQRQTNVCSSLSFYATTQTPRGMRFVDQCLASDTPHVVPQSIFVKQAGARERLTSWPIVTLECTSLARQ